MDLNPGHLTTEPVPATARASGLPKARPAQANPGGRSCQINDVYGLSYDSAGKNIKVVNRHSMSTPCALNTQCSFIAFNSRMEGRLLSHLTEVEIEIEA